MPVLFTSGHIQDLIYEESGRHARCDHLRSDFILFIKERNTGEGAVRR